MWSTYIAPLVSPPQNLPAAPYPKTFWPAPSTALDKRSFLHSTPWMRRINRLFHTAAPKPWATSWFSTTQVFTVWGYQLHSWIFFHIISSAVLCCHGLSVECSAPSSSGSSPRACPPLTTTHPSLFTSFPDHTATFFPVGISNHNT